MTAQLALGATPAEQSSRHSAADLAAVLRRYRLPVSNEAEMQAAIARAFEAERLPFRREVTRGADRIDFVVGRVGIECKVKGSLGDVTRQLHRYVQWDDLDEIVLVTTQAKHMAVPQELGGKTIRLHVVRGMF